LAPIGKGKTKSLSVRLFYRIMIKNRRFQGMSAGVQSEWRADEGVTPLSFYREFGTGTVALVCVELPLASIAV
jgi:hypothetical protein